MEVSSAALNELRLDWIRNFLAIPLLILLFSAFTSAQAFGKTCTPLTPSGLAKLIETQRDRTLQVVFFSSWCSDCAVHLKSLKNTDEILIGAFDKRERIEKVVGKLGLKNPCYMDSGITARLGIKVVPASRLLTEKDL